MISIRLYQYLYVMRYFVRLAYKGTYYSGWQRQTPNIRTVQQVLEDTFAKMLKRPVTLYGCGRTDAGVHASEYFMHVDMPEQLNYDPVFRLNKMLPNDISIFEFIPVNEMAHTRYHARLRRYDYYFHTKKDAMIEDVSTWYNQHDLDEQLMQKVVGLYRSTNDFWSLCKSPAQYKHTRCEVSKVELVKLSDTRYVFTIEADRYLQSMIRLLVGRIFDVGSGVMKFEELEECVVNKMEIKYNKPTHSQGLHLSSILYDNI